MRIAIRHFTLPLKISTCTICSEVFLGIEGSCQFDNICHYWSTKIYRAGIESRKRYSLCFSKAGRGKLLVRASDTFCVSARFRSLRDHHERDLEENELSRLHAVTYRGWLGFRSSLYMKHYLPNIRSSHLRISKTSKKSSQINHFLSSLTNINKFLFTTTECHTSLPR